MRKIVKSIPNAITSMNLLSGVLGVMAALKGHIDTAFILMLCASVFDFCDGLAARLLHAYSDLGKQLDSLSDMVSFGVLPAVMLFAMADASCPCPIKYITLLFAVFAALRLAKFNIDERQHDSFIGLPSPAAAIIAGSLCASLSFTQAWVYPLAAIILGALMVSEIPMFALKLGSGGAKADRKTAIKRTAFLAAAILSVILTIILPLPWPAIFLISFSSYIILNLLIR